MAIIELASGTIEYETYGPDDSAYPPVLFVHGVAVDGRLWRPVAELLAGAGHRCVVPTLPLGSHRVPWGPGADRSPRGAARLLRELVAALDLGDATLVANDTGGAVTQLALEEDPDLVKALVFTNCDAFDLFPPQPFRLVFAAMRQRLLLRPLAQLLRIRAIRHSPLGYGLLLARPDATFTRGVVDSLVVDARIRADLRAFLKRIDRGELDRATRALAGLPLPVTMVWGDDDRCFTPAHGRRFAAIFPSSRFVAVPDASTFVALDAPRAVATTIAEARQVA